MTGHVFHPGHQELHGITVVVKAQAGKVYVGRFDKQDESGVHLVGVSIFDPASQASPADFIARTVKFGVKVDRPHLLVPNEAVSAISRLSEFSS